jgi:hypothetical protein
MSVQGTNTLVLQIDGTQHVEITLTWRQTEQQLLSISWLRLLAATNLIFGILSISSLGMPPVLPVSKRSLLSMNGVLIRLICTTQTTLIRPSASTSILRCNRIQPCNSANQYEVYLRWSMCTRKILSGSMKSHKSECPKRNPVWSYRNIWFACNNYLHVI